MLYKAEGGVQPASKFTPVRMHPAADALQARQKHAALNFQIQLESIRNLMHSQWAEVVYRDNATKIYDVASTGVDS